MWVVRRLGLVLAVLATVLPGPVAAQSVIESVVPLTPRPQEVLPAVDAALEIGIHLPDGPADVGVTVDGLTTTPIDVAPGQLPTGATMWFQTAEPAAVTPGPHTVEVVNPDGTVLSSWPFAISGFGRSRLSGDPDEVAAAVASQVNAGPDLVLVGAGAEDDTASAIALAAALGGSIGIVTGDTLTPATAAQVDDAVGRGGSITIVGGTARVPQSVRDQVAQHVEERIPVTVLAGVSREVTAALVAVHQARNTGQPTRLVLTSPRDLATSFPAAVLAANEGAILLLTGPRRLLPQNRAFVRAIAPSLASAVLVGATVANGPVAAEVRRMLGPDVVTVLPQDDADQQSATALAASSRMGGQLTVVSPEQPADALATGLLAARQGGVAFATDATRRYIHTHPGVTPVTLAARVTEEDAYDLWSVGIDGIDGPTVSIEVTDGHGLEVTITADQPLDAVDLFVSVTDGSVLRTVPGQVSITGQTAVWRPGGIPDDVPRETPLTVGIIGVVAAAAQARHVLASGTATLPPATTTSPEGFIVAGGTGTVVGTGPLRTYSVEIDPATGLDIGDVSRQVDAILSDGRGWTATGARSLQRVGTSGQAAIRVVVATPSTVDAYCGRIGLNTGGRLSCWDGRRAMLNLTRWNTGVSPFHTDLTVYRPYLVSHEVGHGLGFGHVSCPGAGQLAPVMSQQSKGLGGCVANGWPYP